MKPITDNFQFSPAQKRGTLILVGIIIALQVLIFSFNFLLDQSHQINSESLILTQYQAKIDSLKSKKIAQNQPKIFPFNPNYLTEYRAYNLGLSATEFDRLENFRAQNQFINSASDFQRVTGVQDSVLQRISPFFKFPNWVNNKTNATQNYNVQKQNTSVVTTKNFTKTDLNTATKEQLITVNGIGEKLADRIITYRTKLQGYTYNDQLYEVWYLDKAVANRVLEKFTVIQKPNIQKIDINQADFKTVMKLPYMDYELTKKIFNLKNATGKINSLEQLKKIEGFPVDKFDRISLYLKAE